MFEDTITVFNYIKNKSIYKRTEINNVFSYKTNQAVQDGRGVSNASVYHVLLPLESLNNYKEKKEFNKLEDKTDYFTLSTNDVIVLGEFSDIDDLKEIQTSNSEYFTIKIISDNRYGSEDLQNIEVTS